MSNQEEFIVTAQKKERNGQILTLVLIMSRLVAFTVLAHDNMDAVELLVDLAALPSRIG